jgi:cytochrome P450
VSYLLSVYPYDKNNKTNLIELINNATLWIIVGFFTESSFLAGAIYNLLTNPSTLLRLRSELRENFQSKEDITMAGVQKLDYLSAVVNESFRTRPPAPLSLTRIIPKGGAVICGKIVPEDTVVGIPHWAAYRHSENFRYADQFLPERWLQDAKSDFANDDRDVVHAFSYGPRACIAKG